jgi:type I restriction enzyme R subunit
VQQTPLTFFVLTTLNSEGISNPEPTSRRVAAAFAQFANWRRSETELRELRKQVTFAVYPEEDDITKVTSTVDGLFMLLSRENPS